MSKYNPVYIFGFVLTIVFLVTGIYMFGCACWHLVNKEIINFLWNCLGIISSGWLLFISGLMTAMTCKYKYR